LVDGERQGRQLAGAACRRVCVCRGADGRTQISGVVQDRSVVKTQSWARRRCQSGCRAGCNPGAPTLTPPSRAARHTRRPSHATRHTLAHVRCCGGVLHRLGWRWCSCLSTTTIIHHRHPHQAWATAWQPTSRRSCRRATPRCQRRASRRPTSTPCLRVRGLQSVVLPGLQAGTTA
jgi:hypothetical protein